MKKTIITLAIAATMSTAQAADLKVSGFGSINAGQTISGNGVEHYGKEEGFLADYPNVSGYTDELSFTPETLIGVQLDADLGKGLKATTQIVGRANNDFEPTIDWAYITYDLNDDWSVQAGKKRIPLFYYSDFYDVGYAYTWIRPPADNYTWQILNYNGVNILNSGEIGDLNYSINVYAGSETSKDNKLLSEFFFDAEVDETWKDIVGAVFQGSYDSFDFRLTHMQYTNERTIDGEDVTWGGSTDRKGKFYGAALNYDAGDYFILTEMSRLDLEFDGNIDTAMITGGYRIDDYTVYSAYSQTKQSGDGITDGEDHNTTSFGARWDFHSSAALKVQYDIVKDNSYDYAVAGDSEAITFALDFIF